MMNIRLSYVFLFLAAVFVAALSQALLKAEAMRPHENTFEEYVNVRVFVAYLLFFFATFADVIAYRNIPLGLGAVLEATAYFYVTLFGAIFFQEKITAKKIVGLICIFLGIAVFTHAG